MSVCVEGLSADTSNDNPMVINIQRLSNQVFNSFRYINRVINGKNFKAYIVVDTNANITTSYSVHCRTKNHFNKPSHSPPRVLTSVKKCVNFSEMTKDSKTFEGSARLNIPWNDSYSDTSSDEYKVLHRNLIKYLTVVLRNSYQEDFLGVRVENFRPGSVIFDFKVYFKSTSRVTSGNLKEVITKGGDGSEFTITDVDVNQVFVSAIEKQGSGLKHWVIGLIAFVVAIAFFLVLVLIFVVSHLF